jgi:glutamyl-tRNA synthetase
LHGRLDETAITRLMHGMEGLKQRAKTLNELAESAAFYVQKRPLQIETDKARALISGNNQEIIRRVLPVLQAQNHWNQHAIMEAVKAWGEAEGVKLGDIAQPLRAALTGSHISPSTFEVLEVLGREESLARIADVC